MDKFTPMYGDQDSDAKTDKAIGKLVDTFQSAIIILANNKDTRRLTTLQTPTNEAYARADECIAQGKQMVVLDPGD